MGDGCDEVVALGFSRSQRSELTLGRHRVGHEGQGDRRVPRERRREPVGDLGGVGGSRECEAERHVAAATDRHMAVVRGVRTRAPAISTGSDRTGRDEDLRRSGRGATGATPRGGGIQPGRQLSGGRDVVRAGCGHGHAPCVPIGHDRGPMCTDRVGQEVEKGSQPGLGRSIRRQHVERERQQTSLLVGEEVGRAS